MMRKSAILSEDRVYRWMLEREWDDNKPSIAYIMLNPSTADENEDDRTIKKLIKFTRVWGYGGLKVCNIYAYRATDPTELKSVTDPTGSENEKHVRELVASCDKIVFAWGNDASEPEWLKPLVPNPYCLKINKTGKPAHPLYQPDTTILREYPR